MQKKIFLLGVLISLSSLSSYGMNKEEEQVREHLMQDKKNVPDVRRDCGNCWGNEDCYCLCEKLTTCLCAPLIGCYCCCLMLSGQ